MATEHDGAFPKGGGEMAIDAAVPEVNESLHFEESVRHLWEATREVVFGGIDTDDLSALCAIVARLAEHRLSRLQSDNPSSESAAAIERLREYRKSALALLSWTKTPTPEPDWSHISEQIVLEGAPPLEFQK